MPRSKKVWTIDPGAAPGFMGTGIRDIGDDDLRVVFQPIVDTRTGDLFAHEALVRCNAPEFSSPAVLFEAATAEQCVGRLGRRIRSIMTDVSEGGALFVNLHPEELSERWLVRPDDPICSYEGDLYLEITESAAFAYFDLCMGVLREVSTRTGAKLVIDDFGAGYSNLKRIVDLHPHIVKLDRSLIAGIDQDRRQQKLVTGLVHLIEQLGALVVAEGIETEGELSACIDAGAHYAQGFLLARPAYPHPPVHWPF